MIELIMSYDLLKLIKKPRMGGYALAALALFPAAIK
jgi:hypothetical protein